MTPCSDTIYICLEGAAIIAIFLFADWMAERHKPEYLAPWHWGDQRRCERHAPPRYARAVNVACGAVVGALAGLLIALPPICQ